jgi:uncharacterized protein (DUF2342 family)
MTEVIDPVTRDVRDQVRKEFADGGFVKAPTITMAQLPTKIKLEGDLARRLRKLNDHQQAIQQFVAMVTQQGEGRLSELVAEGRQIWSDIAKRHGIDLENVQWNLDKDGETIVPVGMRL